jgi:hypothetical protein
VFSIKFLKNARRVYTPGTPSCAHPIPKLTNPTSLPLITTGEPESPPH